MSELDKLLDSLLVVPGMRIMHFCKDDAICGNLSRFCQKSEDGEYLILTFNEKDYNKLLKYKNGCIKVKQVLEERKRFNTQAKLYDYLFLSTLPKNRESFFKRVYSALKNAAYVFIFLDKNDRMLAYKIESELIESNYVAVSLLEIDGYLAVSCKKMHGWSGS